MKYYPSEYAYVAVPKGKGLEKWLLSGYWIDRSAKGLKETIKINSGNPDEWTAVRVRVSQALPRRRVKLPNHSKGKA